jgi:hypothetical protein
MQLTSGNVTYPATYAGKSAMRRLEEYQGRIERAKGSGFRSQLWIRLGWLVAESNLRPAVEQSAILAALDDWLTELNERSASS